MKPHKLQIKKIVMFAILFTFLLTGLSFAVTICPDGMVSYWRFDEGTGTTAVDSVDENNGTISGANWTTGKIGDALNFEDSDYVEIPDNENLRPGNITVEVWVYMTSVGGYGNILVKKYYDGWQSPYITYQMGHPINEDKAQFTVLVGGTHYSVTGNSIPLNTWHYIVGTYDGETVKIYQDGEFVAENTAPSGSIDSRPYSIILGKVSNNNWLGKIDEVAIYNRSLSAAEIADHYNNGIGKDYCAEPTVTLNSPLDNTFSPSGDITFNCSATTRATLIENITLYIWNATSDAIYYTYTETPVPSTSATLIKTVLGIPDGDYKWNCLAYNNESQFDWDVNRTFTVARQCGGVTTCYCGDVVSESYIMSGPLLNSTGGTVCPAHGLIIYSNDVVLDCRGNTITGTGSGNGVYLDSRQNVTIKNCQIKNFSSGIYFTSSNYSNLTNNTAINNTYGIYLDGWSSNNTLTNNTANSNYYYGIYLGPSSNNNTLTNNTANDNTNTGVYLFYSDGNNLINNNASSNNIYGIYIYRSSSNNLTNDMACYNLEKDLYFYGGSGNIVGDNTCDISEGAVCTSACPHLPDTTISECGNLTEKRVYYLNQNTSTSGTCFTVEGIGAILDCQGNTITGDGTGYGIHVNNKEDVTIRNCIIENFSRGIHLDYSNNNNITNNTIVNSSGYGIYLYRSSSNTINNTINENTGTGLYFEYSSGSTLTNNISNNGEHGIYLRYSSNSIRNNIISNNSNRGIGLFDSSGSIIGNTITENFMGIYGLLYAAGSNIRNNNISSNSWGIRFSGYATGNNIINNTISSNSVVGIHISANSDFHGVRNNNISLNNIGIRLLAPQNTVINNTINSNTEYGIQLSSSSNTVTGNTVTNSITGISVTGSSHTISENTITGNQDGVNITNSLNNQIYHNNIFDNTNKQVYSDVGVELSYNNEGNWWGHIHPPFFTEGIDSNAIGVNDSYPYVARDCWEGNCSLITATSGGSVTADTTTVTVPAGAMTEDTGISVIPGRSNFIINTTLGDTLMLGDYEIGPVGTTFTEPVTIVFSYNDTGLTLAQEDSLDVFWYNSTSGQWEAQDCAVTGNPNCIVDTTANTITLKITHFSNYGVGLPAPPVFCGDGVTEGLEECDDGNLNNLDTCSNDCKFTYCGDSLIQSPNGYIQYEECDPPELACIPPYVEGGSCTYCNATCQNVTLQGGFCGDGSVQSPQEECDDGNTQSGDGCNSICQIEECDPGSTQLCQLQGGVCGGSVETCTPGGQWPGCDETTYSSWDLAYEVNETSCDDGLDNDCDGSIDGDDLDCKTGPTQACEYVGITEEGTHSLFYDSKDVAGNFIATVEEIISLDLYPPNTTIYVSGTPGNSPWYVSAVDVSFTVTDTILGSGPDETKYGINVPPTLTYTGIPFPISSEGTTTVNYYSTDIAGWQEETQTETIYIDTVAPNTTITLTGSEGYNKWFYSNVTVTLDATDATSGPAFTEYCVYHPIANPIDCNIPENYITYTTPFIVSYDGISYVYYKSTDVAGNEEVADYEEVKIDNVPPDPTIVYDPGDWSIDGNVTFHWDPIEDEQSGTDHYEIHRCSVYNATTTCTVVWYSNTTDATQITFNESGLNDNTAYYYAVYVVDRAGFRSDISNIVDIVVDMTPPYPPTLDPIGIGNGFLNTSYADLSWTSAEDPGVLASGLNKHNLYEGDVPFTEPITLEPTLSLLSEIPAPTITYTHTNLIEAITYYYRVSGVDNAGNEGNRSNEQHVTIDLTAPNSTITLIGVEGRFGWYLSNVTVEIDSTDDISKVKKIKYRLNGGAWTTYYEPFEISNEGTTTVGYRAEDFAGNVELEKTVDVKIDTRKPTTTDDAPTGWQNTNVTVTLFPDDPTPGSGIYATRYCTHIYPTIDCTPSGDSTSIFISDEGITTLLYYSEDVAGNIEDTRSATVWIDMTPPVTTATVTGVLEPEPFEDWFFDNATVLLSAIDPLPPSGDSSGVAATYYCVDQNNTCTPTTEGNSLVVSDQGINYVRFYSIDNANNAEEVKNITVRIDKDTDGDSVYDNFDACPTIYGKIAFQGCPYGDSNTVEMHIIDRAKTGICGCSKKAEFETDDFEYKEGCTREQIDDAESSQDYFECIDSAGFTTITIHSVNLANATTFAENEVEINEVDIGNFVYIGQDAAGLYMWQVTLPQLDPEDEIELELEVYQIYPDCKPARSCKEPVDGAAIRVFDRNDPEFQALWTKNPKGTKYPDVYEAGVGWIGSDTALYQKLNASCITDVSGSCIAGDPTIGDYLVIAKFRDSHTGKTVYTGRPKSPEDFKDTDEDGIADLVHKYFQIIKVIKKDGSITYKAGSKTVITGSLLEIIYPQYTIWENIEELYPFILTSDSDWTVDICVYIPTGYEIHSIMDAEGNLIPTANCTQTFVANETKVVLFTVAEIASPEPDVNITIRAVGPSGIETKIGFEIPGERVRPPEEIWMTYALIALVAVAAFIVIVAIGIILAQKKPRRRR